MLIGFEYECLHLDRPDSGIQYTLYQKSDLCIPRNETARPHSQFLYSVNDLYIPWIGLPIWLQQNRQTDPGSIQIAHRYMNVKIGRQNMITLF